MLRYFKDAQSDCFKPIVVPKYTTREAREDDGEDVVCVGEIPEHCDVIYEQYEDRYGFQLDSLFRHLSAGRSPIIVLNDVRAVEDIRNAVGPVARSLYLFRASPNFKEAVRLATARGAERARAKADAEKRVRKAQAIHRIYIENITMFDHVILNHSTFDYLKREIDEIVRGLMPYQAWPLNEMGRT